MIGFLVKMVLAGRISVEQIPEKYAEAVRAALTTNQLA